MQIETSDRDKTLIDQNLESLKILVVDDEPVIRETLSSFLNKLGVGYVMTADHGKSALSELERATYDYVFIDLMMPCMDGLEALKIIQKFHSPTNVILMTGYPSMDIVIEAIHFGASDFLVKPFRFQDIKITLNRLQRFHLLLEKNWVLRQELEEKKELEQLNNQLEKRIKLQSLMYNIVDSLSRINQSEELYTYLVNKAVESCSAKKACFMIYDETNSRLLNLAQKGLKDMLPGVKTDLKKNFEGHLILDYNFIKNYFGKTITKDIYIGNTCRLNGFMAISFDIRKEPFGILLVAAKDSKTSFDQEDEFILKFLADKAALNIENIALYDNIKQSLMASLTSLVSALEAKDKYTQQHSTRVTDLSKKIALKMGCSHSTVLKLDTSGPIHDIGKIGINDAILNKPGKLTEEEYNHIKTHPLIGENIAKPLGLDDEELAIIRNHHERWDGKGYPDGLKGEEIPRISRILSVADAFDAMNSSRAYRKALPFSECLSELKNNSGTQFDPNVIEALLSIFPTTN